MSTPTANTKTANQDEVDPAASRVMLHAPAQGVRRSAPHLSPEQLEAFGREMDALRDQIVSELGERDATYIRKVIKAQRSIEVAGRVLMQASAINKIARPAWIAGVAALTVSKILDNMEIGHNVMHGQYDWMKDDQLNGRKFEWDTVCPGENWRHSHNYVHHTHTNIHGLDRDIGYGLLRISEDQRWKDGDQLNVVKAFLLMVFFEWGVAFHDLETERLASGEREISDVLPELKRVLGKIARQGAKDYVMFPAFAGPRWKRVLAGNAAANIGRNLWAFSIIFCGHFPDGIEEFTQEETANETRGEWYLRQLLGSGNLSGGPLFHLMSGNLSHQIEHHLFPDLPAHRYAEISVDVRDACERYGLKYTTGPLHHQLGTVWRKLYKLSIKPSVEERQAKRAQAAAAREAASGSPA